MEYEPQIIKKDGEKEFAVLRYKDYLKIKQALEDNEDLIDLRKVKIETVNEPGVPFNNVKESFSKNKS